jgi:hypothetical protein
MWCICSAMWEGIEGLSHRVIESLGLGGGGVWLCEFVADPLDGEELIDGFLVFGAVDVAFNCEEVVNGDGPEFEAVGGVEDGVGAELFVSADWVDVAEEIESDEARIEGEVVSHFERSASRMKGRSFGAPRRVGFSSLRAAARRGKLSRVRR